MKEKSELAKAMEKSVKYRDENYVSFIEPPSITLENFKHEFYQGLLKQDPETIARWVEQLGSPNTRANVVDANGELVFWVPQISYGLASTDTDSMVNETDKFEKTKETHAVAASNALMKFFSKNITLSAPPKTDVEQWKLILSYFGDISPETKTGPNDKVDEEEEYDEI